MHGIDPQIDFKDSTPSAKYTSVARHDGLDRHPYAGELVSPAFSGSHQDAIRRD